MERPILFSGEMVRAILSGQKTQTRRVIKPQSLLDNHTRVDACHRCPYGAPGDLMWVRETCGLNIRIGTEYGGWPYEDDEAGKVPKIKPDNMLTKFHSTGYYVQYAANNDERVGPWTPSIFMPRWASRITLRVTDVRVERLQEISEGDVNAEGITSDNPYIDSWLKFAYLWDSINADRGYSWDSNPWVWVIEFEKNLAFPGRRHCQRCAPPGHVEAGSIDPTTIEGGQMDYFFKGKI